MKLLKRASFRAWFVTLAACTMGAVNANASEGGLWESGIDSTYLAAPPQHDDLGILRVAQARGPRMYFGAEATFFSREYDLAPTSFGLSSSTPSLAVPPGTGIGDPGFNPLEWSWSAGTLADAAALESDFDHADQLRGAPRLTLGIVGGNGFGIQGRYWQMNDSVAMYDPVGVFPIGGGADPRFGMLDRTAGADRFESYIVDLEGTKDFGFLGWNLLGTLGARYAEFDHERSNAAIGRIETGALNGLSNNMYSLGTLQEASFHGTGVTSSLTGLRQLGRSNFSLFASVRGSALWGTANSYAQADAAYDGFYGSETFSDAQLIRDRETLYITELQAGLQWSRNVRFLNGQMFARGAFEYQFWRVDGGEAAATATVGDFGVLGGTLEGSPGSPGLPDYLSGIGTTEGTATASSARHDFDLIGFSLMTGFVF